MDGSRAVLFDVDGVLLDTGALFRDVWSRWAAARSLVPATVVAYATGRRTRDVLREVAPDLDHRIERRALDELTAAAVKDVRPVAGASSLLGSVRDLPWAIVSCGSRWFVHACFEASGLPLPAVQIFDEDVCLGKPSPEGYLAAARRLGVAPANCVVVEDTPHGVRAGASAGCTVVAVATTHRPEQLHEADTCLPDLTAVAHLLHGAGIAPAPVVVTPARTSTNGGRG